MPANHRTGLYAFSSQRDDSVVLGKNFLTLTNPTGSGRRLHVVQFTVSYMATVAGAAYPMRGYRATSTPTGGTLQAASAICKFDTALPDSVAQIRTGNPSVTLDGAFFNSPPGTVKDTVEAPADSTGFVLGFNPFLLRQGESVVLRQDVGTVGHLWNFTVTWQEVNR